MSKDASNDDVIYKIVSVEEALNMQLNIPNYQRPYKWTVKNVSDLLGDIATAIDESASYSGYKYRIGTVILHEKNVDVDKVYDVVDGQQRLITLSLLRRALNDKFDNPLLQNDVDKAVSKQNVSENFRFLKEWTVANKNLHEKLKAAFLNVFEVVVLIVKELPEAFQLFDSQNTRGRSLDPHDLLKAYHLRETNDYAFEKYALIRRWEDIPAERIRNLFSLYLYPILQWSRREKSKEFTAQEIDVYKGVSANCRYTYAQRVQKAMPYFQIDLPFAAGGDFFRMVQYYIEMSDNLKNEVKTNPAFAEIRAIIAKNSKKGGEKFKSTGFSYAVNLFYCALMFYYDRFHLLDERAVKKLFAWAMMIRVDMRSLGFKTINDYAIGYGHDVAYTNRIAMFFEIATARNSGDIGNIRLQIVKNDGKANDAWQELHASLKALMGVE